MRRVSGGVGGGGAGSVLVRGRVAGRKRRDAAKLARLKPTRFGLDD